jgi:response regulator NasT
MSYNEGIILTVGNEEGAKILKKALSSSGYGILEVCKNGSETLRTVRRLNPELVIINYDLPDTTGVEVGRIIAEDNLCSVLVLVSQSQKVYVDKFKGELDMASLVKPFKKMMLVNTVDILIKNRRKVRKLEYEIENLRIKMEIRKIVDKAKGLLILLENVTEEEAHRAIQKMSMDTGTPIKKIAEEIIDKYGK